MNSNVRKARRNQFFTYNVSHSEERKTCRKQSRPIFNVYFVLCQSAFFSISRWRLSCNNGKPYSESLVEHIFLFCLSRDLFLGEIFVDSVRNFDRYFTQDSRSSRKSDNYAQ